MLIFGIMASLSDRLTASLTRAHAGRSYRRFVRAARQARASQDRVLREIIASAAESNFGREHGFAGIRDYPAFARRVPVRTYETLRPYLDRVIAGDTEALFARGTPVLMFALTSGSTESPKYVPVTPRFLREYRRGWRVFGGKALLDHPDAFLRPILQTVSPMDEHNTARNVPCGAISGLLAATQKRIVRKYYTTPAAAGKVEDSAARYYTIVRFALPQDVGWMVTASPATQLKIAAAMATHSERLIRDIRDGTLTPPGETPAEVRDLLAAHLRPDAVSAARLDALARREGRLLPRDCWRLAFLANWTGGTLGLHLRDFPKYFGAVPVRDIGLLATEGRVTIPLEDGTPGGVLDVPGAFFEFAESNAALREHGALFRAHELTAGRDYRVVLTNFAGLYRYDLGDHVRVLGFCGEAPVLEFLHRGAFTSSLTGEKLTEWQVTCAFERASAGVAGASTSFVFAPVWGEPPCYRLHVERIDGRATHLAARLDQELRAINIEYASKRASGRLGGVVVNVLPPGRLAQLDAERQQRRGPANEQFKHQFLYQQPGDDDELLASTSAVPRTELAGTAG